MIDTALLVCVDEVSHSSEMSSSVGPIPSWFSGDSDHGRYDAIRFAGVMPLLPLCPGMGKKRLASMGDCPCFEVITMSVVSSNPFVRSSLIHCPTAASTH